MITRVPHPIEVLHGRGVALACSLDGQVQAQELHGLFAGDTRVLSTYRITVAGAPFRLLARTRLGPSTAQWHFQNPALQMPAGAIDEGSIYLGVRRRVSGALHDDLVLCSYVTHPVTLRLALQIDADFADVFEVKSRSMPARLSVARRRVADGIALTYEHGDFQRGLGVRIEAPSAWHLVGGQVVFDVRAEPAAVWRCCIEATPVVGRRVVSIAGDPHAREPTEDEGSPRLVADARIAEPFAAGVRDLLRLRMQHGDAPPFVAAGAPWFMALFGRDTLVTSLMAGLLGPWVAHGALDALARLQARERDDDRDAQPGKIAHEMRWGELAHFRRIPHTPYYGTHDAPALYVLALWNALRWTGDRSLLERYLPAAHAAMEWCTGGADPDGDGFLEYRTLSPRGYRNQAWKDAGDAIVHDDGRLAELPNATVELQGYLFAAELAMAELCATCGDEEGAAKMRRAARAMRARVEERLWMEAESCFALALDGRKVLVRSIASNQGHLLWCGLPSPDRARRVAARLLAGDMFSGWGLRTLSSRHRAYNPLSYQLGSVWPHDTAIVAAGLARYGLREQAWRLLEAMLDAAAAFEEHRLPELFCGFDRGDGPPVPYEKANSPQAWAAAAPLLAVQLALGIVPDAPRGRCHLAPSLPPWLPEVEILGLPIAGHRVDIRVARESSGRIVIERRGDAGLEWGEGTPAAPLWGSPPAQL